MSLQTYGFSSVEHKSWNFVVWPSCSFPCHYTENTSCQPPTINVYSKFLYDLCTILWLFQKAYDCFLYKAGWNMSHYTYRHTYRHIYIYKCLFSESTFPKLKVIWLQNTFNIAHNLYGLCLWCCFVLIGAWTPPAACCMEKSTLDTAKFPLLCFTEERTNMVWNNFRLRKSWQNVHFWVNYPCEKEICIIILNAHL